MRMDRFCYVSFIFNEITFKVLSLIEKYCSKQLYVMYPLEFAHWLDRQILHQKFLCSKAHFLHHSCLRISIHALSKDKCRIDVVYSAIIILKRKQRRVGRFFLLQFFTTIYCFTTVFLSVFFLVIIWFNLFGRG